MTTPARVGSSSREDVSSIASMSMLIEEKLASVLRSARSCALVDFPHHRNVGDHAIWLGEKAYLTDAGVTISYVGDDRTYAPEALAAALRRHPGPLLISGGGNLGDIWPREQRFRERIIEDFRDWPIVQLPQSIHFGNGSDLDRARNVFDSHPDLVLLVRDRPSLEVARHEFKTPSYLCPDMAFVLGRLARPTCRTGRILWLARRDPEARHPALDIADPLVDVVDWPKEAPPRPREIQASAAWWVSRVIRGTRTKLPKPLYTGAAKALPWCFGTLATRKLQLGIDMIGAAEVVVTDRLHGHILSLLLGVPHVLLDNSYGKVGAFYQTWTRTFEGCSWADTPEQAYQLARGLLDSVSFERAV